LLREIKIQSTRANSWGVVPRIEKNEGREEKKLMRKSL